MANIPQYRAYFFGNMYLSPIQHGIQAAHVVTRLFVNYPFSKNQLDDDIIYPCDVLYTWGRDHLTKILLNGGYQSNLQKIYNIFEVLCPLLMLPYDKFNEEQDSLNGALTSVGVVVDISKFDVASYKYDIVHANDFGNVEAITIDEIHGRVCGSTRPIDTYTLTKLLYRTLQTAKLV